jgi:hypothetical protein
MLANNSPGGIVDANGGDITNANCCCPVTGVEITKFANIDLSTKGQLQSLFGIKQLHKFFFLAIHIFNWVVQICRIPVPDAICIQW